MVYTMGGYMRHILKFVLIFVFISVNLACVQNEFVYPLDLAYTYPGQLFVASLLVERVSINEYVRSKLYPYNQISELELKRLARLGFVAENLYKNPSIRTAFGLWADQINFNCRDRFLVKKAAKMVIDLSRIGWAQAYLNRS